MNATVKTALRESIAHLERARDERRYVIVGRHTCPLCLMFNNRKTPVDRACVGCPVHDATEMGACKGTPFFPKLPQFKEGTVSLVQVQTSEECSDEVWRSCAQAMADYLRGLMPVGKKA